jgi:glycosidase
VQHRYALPWRVRGPERRFHVSLEARRRFGVAEELVTVRGDVMLVDLGVVLELAHRVTRERPPGAPPLRGADLYAGALLEEAYHLLIARYLETVDPAAFQALDSVLHTRLGLRAEATFRRFLRRYPTVDIARGLAQPDEYLSREIEGVPGRLVAIEELWTCFLANANPGLRGARALVDDRPLAAESDYDSVIDTVRAFWRGQPGAFGRQGSLFDLLLEPIEHAPDDLAGQLRFVQTRWGGMLGDRFARLARQLLAGLDQLREADAERGGGPPGPPAPPSLRHLPAGAVDEERFSADSAWMPRVVMIAKNAYVWLDQLSRASGRPIEHLDQVPDEALRQLAGRGFTALWLIGLWERSAASRTIKRLRGQPDAVASAYALHDYVVAADLGGEGALAQLRQRAAAHGIRLASDMVPNHVGIDGRWVVEHPEWFVQLDHSPFPGYTFGGPDVSADPRVDIRIEDHYYDGSDAAVVFRRVDRVSSDARFIYHGNDGTSMPWNDTAQLDYLNPDVREAVIQTILHVARQFPIIRFDAAMTLAREHVRRLWYPSPGSGGAIPSRARYGAMSDEDFDRAMPTEFWREVVDRVAVEVPDTLLLAEAFWMMEGYFVRTLGMHRVYNSAFMHMLMREENARYRALIAEVLEFEPQVLQRFVNFLSNPDEETARAQFGDGDKYFAAATVLATMPGLPMVAHGQVEGFHEKYGMEYRRAKLDERPDAALVARHEREIFPLLRRRWQFAEVDGFRLFDVVDALDHVQEPVLAYSNRVGDARSLVLVNNRYERSTGAVRSSVPFRHRWEAETRRVDLVAAWGFRGGPRRFTVMREHRSGESYLIATDALRERGLEVQLDGYEARVYLDVHERFDADGALARLAERLGGRGTPSLDDALADVRLEDAHAAFEALLDALHASDRGAAGRAYTAQAAMAAEGPVTVARAPTMPARGAIDRVRAAVGPVAARLGLAAFALRHLAWPQEALQRLRLVTALERSLRARDRDDPPPAVLAPLLAHLPAAGAPLPDPGAFLAAVVGDAAAAEPLGRNEHAGVAWYRREGLEGLLDVALATLRFERPGAGAARALATWRHRVLVAAEASGYRVDEALAAVSVSDGRGGGSKRRRRAKRSRRSRRSRSRG